MANKNKTQKYPVNTTYQNGGLNFDHANYAKHTW